MSGEKTEKDMSFISGHPDRNWEEDITHENGNYINRCIECKLYFKGHKRRPICKLCANKPIDWEQMAEKKPPTQHEGWAWQGCWADGEMTGFARCMVKKVKPLESENAALKAALAELIPIADYYHDREVTYTGMPYKTWNDIIDRAKKLLNKQPQSESDGDKNLS